VTAVLLRVCNLTHHILQGPGVSQGAQMQPLLRSRLMCSYQYIRSY
jgi:hypothetical protein